MKKLPTYLTLIKNNINKIHSSNCKGKTVINYFLVADRWDERDMKRGFYLMYAQFITCNYYI